MSLKALANQVLERDKLRDSGGTPLSQDAGTTAVRWDAAPISKDDFEERAAIVEYDAGIPREWAEGFARLCEMPRPIGFSPQRWRQLLNDAGKFMDCWASRVAALGWTTEEVFGAHPVAPDARQDAKGLVALIGGHQVVAVSASTITIFTQSKSRFVLRRSQRAYDAQPLWQLQ